MVYFAPGFTYKKLMHEIKIAHAGEKEVCLQRLLIHIKQQQ